MPITVYTTPSCPGCLLTKKALDKHRVAYETVDISQDKDAHAYVTGLGYTSAPVVVVDENTSWAGFRPDRIKELGLV